MSINQIFQLFYDIREEDQNQNDQFNKILLVATTTETHLNSNWGKYEVETFEDVHLPQGDCIPQ